MPFVGAMYKKGTGNNKQGKDAGNQTLCPYRNFSQAIIGNLNLALDAIRRIPKHFQVILPHLSLKMLLNCRKKATCDEIFTIQGNCRFWRGLPFHMSKY